MPECYMARVFAAEPEAIGPCEGPIDIQYGGDWFCHAHNMCSPEEDERARLRERVTALEAEVAWLREALRFYGRPESWREVREQDAWDVAAIDASDEEGFPSTFDSIGGKRAREALGGRP